MLGQHDHGRARPPQPDLPCRLESLGRLGGRHPDVGQDQVGPQRAGQVQQPLRVPGGAHHVQARVAQDPAEALTQQHRILGDDHPQRRRGRPGHGHGISARSRVPPPAGVVRGSQKSMTARLWPMFQVYSATTTPTSNRERSRPVGQASPRWASAAP